MVSLCIYTWPSGLAIYLLGAFAECGRVIGPYGQLAPSVEPTLVTCRRDAAHQIGMLRSTSTLGYG